MFRNRFFSKSSKPKTAGNIDEATKVEVPKDDVVNAPVSSEVVPSAPQSKPTADAPVRLLRTAEFIKFTDGVPFYEVVPEFAYVEVSFSEFLASFHEETAVISWRWKAAKPSSKQAALDALKIANPVPAGLVAHVGQVLAKVPEIKYLWLDWSCAPQYPENDITATMREINRSGTYYQKARQIIVWCFDDLGDDNFSFSDYFGRAWTLSERLNRSRASNYLRGFDVVPQCLSLAMGSSSTPLRVTSDESAWNLGVDRFVRGLKIQERLTTDAMIDFAQRFLIKRYPLLDAAFSAMNGLPDEASLAKVLPAPVLALTSTTLLLRAFSEWLRRPDPISRGSVAINLGIDFDDLTRFLVRSIVQEGRKRINNMPDTSLSGSLENLVSVEADLSVQGLDALETQTKRVFELALSQRTLEVADENWLARYLTYEIGLYRAFNDKDKLFAVYKLFADMPDRTYDDVELVWRDLCAKAGPHLALLAATGDNVTQPWISQLSVVQSESDVGRPFFAPNLRPGTQEELDARPGAHPLNFGVLAYPPARKPSSRDSFESVFCRPELVEVEEMLTYVLGFNLDEKAAVALGNLTSFSLVDKREGTEIDTHLSLRGRKALEGFEFEFHRLLRQCFAIKSLGSNPETPFVTPANNGLFICVRYSGRKNLTKVVIVRASATEPGKWTPEAVACFTGEPQKGSSWGVAKCLDNLVKDCRLLPGTVNFSCRRFENRVVSSEAVKLETATTSDADAKFFTEWSIDDKTAPQPPSSFRPELVPTTPSDSEDNSLEDLMVVGKTTLDAAVEFARVRKAFRLVVASQGSSEMLGIYYKILQRNYLVDEVMARKIEYFGDLCDILTQQIKDMPALLQIPLIKQFFDYLVEDMIDAVDMAEGRTSDDILEKVRAQRRALMQVVEADD